MLKASATLDLHARTINLEIAVAPDSVAIAPVYQDFLDKWAGPISITVDVVQEKDANGVLMYPGHAVLKMSLTDADDALVIDPADLPSIPEAPIVPPSDPTSPAAPPTSTNLMEMLKASMAAQAEKAQDPDAGVVKL